jgi:hypothetical protein
MTLENMSLMPVVLEVAIVKLNWYKSAIFDQILVAVMQVQRESLCYEIEELNAVIVVIYLKGDKTGCSKLSLSDTYRNLLHTCLSILSLYVVCKGEKRCLVGKCEGKILLLTPGHRLADGVKMGFKGVRWENMNWKIYLNFRCVVKVYY